jgi:Trk K+ transport system NAD-binding subunit
VARFRELGVAIVDVDTAIVNLLEQYTRAPQTTALLLRDDPNYAVTQITISNPDVNGLPVRDLRLPSDVLVLGIVREGHAVVPHGHSVVRCGDEITLIGHPDSLEGVTVHLGF